MPDEKKLDPFKPQQPRIPGVPISAEEKQPALRQPDSEPIAPGQQESSARGLWVSLVVVSVLIIVAAVLVYGHMSLPAADQPASSSVASTSSSPAAVPSSEPAEDLPVGPGDVAKADALANAWSSVRFLFRNPITGETAPAMAVRLPGGEYWGFSLREPFGTCDLEYVTDLDALRTNYNYTAAHPMVVDPCNNSVFDLTRYGTTPSGAVVRGEIEQGGAIRPPIAIEIRKEGNEIRAVRME